MKRVIMSAAVAVVLASTAGCGGGESNVDVEHEKMISCYDKSGRFVEYDDDCEDDGLFLVATEAAEVVGSGQDRQYQEACRRKHAEELIMGNLADAINAVDLETLKAPDWFSSGLPYEQPSQVARLLLALSIAGVAASEADDVSLMDGMAKQIADILEALTPYQRSEIILAMVDGYCGLLEVATRMSEMSGVSFDDAAAADGHTAMSKTVVE